MIAAMGNINIMEASQRTGTWLLLHAHGIITQSHRQQQLQIKANIKSGNFPWHRLKVTSSGTSNLQLASLPPTLNLTEANLTEPHQTSLHLTSPSVCFAFCVPYASSKGFPVYAVACQLFFAPLPTHRVTSHPLCNCFVRQMQGTWRMPRLLRQANDRLNIYYLQSFALFFE